MLVERLCAMAGRHLVLASRTVPELPGLPQACVYYPAMDERERRPFGRVFPGSAGLSTPFDPGQWWANWWWGITPSALVAMVDTQPHFNVVDTARGAFDTVVIARRDPPA
jgi:hypothetical protein